MKSNFVLLRKIAFLFFATVFLPCCDSTVFSASPTSKVGEYRVNCAWWIDRPSFLFGMIGEEIEADISQENTLQFLSELDPDRPWGAVVFTDGKEYWTTFFFMPKPGSFQQRQKGGEILEYFHAEQGLFFALGKEKYEIIPYGDFHFLAVPQKLSEKFAEKEGELPSKVREILTNLSAKCDFGFQVFRNEWEFYPTLPPEQENESPYLQHVRKGREKSQSEGRDVKDDGTESTFFGLEWNGKNWKTFLETRAKPNSPLSEQYEILSGGNPAPFGVAGFQGDFSSFQTSYRHLAELSEFSDTYYLLRLGAVLLAPGEREEGEDEKNYQLSFYAGLRSNIPEEIGEDDVKTDWKNTGPLFVGIPVQPENIPPVEGVLSAKEMHELNGDLRDRILAFLGNLTDFSTDSDSAEPIDFALGRCEGNLLFGCSFPERKIFLDPTLLESVKISLFNLFEKTKTPRESGQKAVLSEDFEQFLKSLTFSPTGDHFGRTVFYQLCSVPSGESDEKVFLPLLLGIGPNFLGVVVFEELPNLLNEWESGEVPLRNESLEKLVKNQRNLLLKALEKSEKLKAENVRPPEELLRMETEDGALVHFRRDVEGRISRFSLEFTHDTMPQIYALARTFGAYDYLREMILR